MPKTNDRKIEFMKNRNTITICTTILLACFGFLPGAQPVVPAPDGGYPGQNTAEGENALLSLTTGANNTAVGWFSLKTLTTGQFNTALGAGALFSTATSNLNTATGAAALFSNTTGFNNTANGALSLFSNTMGFNNTAVGRNALFSNTTGDSNTAMGRSALQDNTTGGSNTAIGQEALIANVGGGGQTAVGYRALRLSTVSGQFCFGNTAVGSFALDESTDGCGNTAIGSAALGSNTTGSSNVAVGLLAGNNVTTANNVICIGTTVGGANVSNSCFIGNIWSQPGGSQAVYVNSDGKLGAQVSSARFKDEIKPMEQASELIYGLKPVSFRYKGEIEPTRPRGFGLIAEDVERISPDLVTRGGDGQLSSVRYEMVNAMLLNEFLKEHRKVAAQDRRIQEHETTIAELKKDFRATVAQLTARLEEQQSQIQQATAQIEMSKFATGRIRRGGPESRLANH
jgi:hypothetical protein